MEAWNSQGRLDPSFGGDGIAFSTASPVRGTGDSNTAPDWQVVDNHLVRLRAERAGKGNGRTYTITIACTDTEGASSTQEVKVLVPKSR